MGKYKEYIDDLGTRLGKDFCEVTESDIRFDFMKSAQRIFSDKNSSPEEREKFKEFLPEIPISLVSDCYRVGDILTQENTLDGSRSFYIITK